MVLEYMNGPDACTNAKEENQKIHWDFIRLALASVARLAVIPFRIISDWDPKRGSIFLLLREKLEMADEEGAA